MIINLCSEDIIKEGAVPVIKNETVQKPDIKPAIQPEKSKKPEPEAQSVVRETLKGEKLDVTPEGVIYMKLLKPLKIDLTNGWIFE